MPNLASFAAFARKVGAVPHVPQAASAWGTEKKAQKNVIEQSLREAVPHVPHVPRENDDAWTDEDWQAAYDERAGILEYDEGLPRAEAEKLARQQVFGYRPIGSVRLTIAREGTSR